MAKSTKLPSDKQVKNGMETEFEKKSEEEGNELRLAIVKSIVEQHGVHAPNI